MEATLRMFNALPPHNFHGAVKGYPNQTITEQTIQHGFVFDDKVYGSYTKTELEILIPAITKVVGLTAKQMNASLHKSWGVVADSDDITLAIHQIAHYITTYGFDSLGIYDDSTVYVPQEALNLPEIDATKIKLKVVTVYTESEMKSKLLTLLGSGIALDQQSVDDSVAIATALNLDNDDIESIKNKEVKCAIYASSQKVPSDPVEFLRYVVYKSTGKTLIIKSDDAIEELAGMTADTEGMFKLYDECFGLERLSSIFLRFKPLFLALKKHNEMGPYINKLRKLAKKNHKPMPADLLNDITKMIKSGDTIEYDDLQAALDRVNTARKIRLAQALNYRASDGKNVLYLIRNGKGYVDSMTQINKVKCRAAHDVVLMHVIMDIQRNVAGKLIYIPNYINYALPSSGKQFVGNIPAWSSVRVDSNMVFGIHWFNQHGQYTDLDLSLISTSGQKYGWNGMWRDDSRSLLFSGDQTSAPRPQGASELFYVSKNVDSEFIVAVNNYNRYDCSDPVEFSLIVGEKGPGRFSEKYMMSQSEIMAMAKTQISTDEKIAGLLRIAKNECRFYFLETSISKSSSFVFGENQQKTMQYLSDYTRSAISLNDVLTRAGAVIIDNKEDADIDLSPENLEKDTILNLIS